MYLKTASSFLATDRLKLAVRLTGLFGLGAYLVSRVDPVAVQESWRGMSVGGFILVISSFLISMAVRVWRWWVALRGLGLSGDPLVFTRNFLGGVLLGIVTPMRLGEVWKLADLGGEGPIGERRMRAGSALLLEKGYEVLVLSSLVGLGLALDIPGFAWLGALILVGWLVGVLIFVSGWGGSDGWMGVLIGKVPTLKKLVLGARDGIKARDRYQIFALSYLAQFLNMVGGYQIYQAFGDLPFWRFFFGMPLATFSSAVPITISGFGLREVAAMAIFGGGGYTPDAAAVAASLVFLGANVLPAFAVVFVELVLRRQR